MAKFGYTIAYVPDVEAELAFFEQAFGFKRKFVAPEGDYGELETGGCTLAFASHSLGKDNLPQGYVAADASSQPLGIEIGLVVDDVASANQAALDCGAVGIRKPHLTSWGQQVAWVRSPSGILVELGTHMDA